ncbi:DUF4188 domain-containing protein [Ornithinimicrobium sp. F0845]|uniref:DUF4188 domain-containing protein n=1 Tax=Ornithinimicrobium sp. F0845 TaxID=2926412 RepID=UPI001FF62781|nr:DUF4188 domain-containing protein [Ornithinimicrobium sp. F0845]MCK0112099.1 DUF4188 domain-containing protein [Ornithinimicrobium sp. F0845]
MRTQDFSRAPDIAQAGVMFVGGTRYTSPAAWLRHAGRYRTMITEMKRMRGYRGHRTYWQPPFTLGTIAWFDTMDDLMLFARTGTHRELMAWVTDGTRNATGGWIRVYTADPHGYTNGVWRAEGNVMRNIDTFTPIAKEQVGPPVVRHKRATKEPMTGPPVDGQLR